jgi:RP/EB family microtubule-associated protein
MDPAFFVGKVRERRKQANASAPQACPPLWLTILRDPFFFAFFLSLQVVLLKWLNDFFDAGYSKVEQTCTGAMHCQILDAIYPGKVPLGKVNFDAKTEYEYVANYKVLQTVFDQQQITKHVDVARLVKGKFQDNLEMLQWIKQFFDSHYGSCQETGTQACMQR